MRAELIEELVPLIEKHVTAAFNAGFDAGKAAHAFPWRDIYDAPRDGRTLILAVGAMAVTGFWHPGRKEWTVIGSKRVIQPQFYMLLPPLPDAYK